MFRGESTPNPVDKLTLQLIMPLSCTYSMIRFQQISLSTQTISYNLCENDEQTLKSNRRTCTWDCQFLKVTVTGHMQSKPYKRFIEYTAGSSKYFDVRQYFWECAKGMRTVRCRFYTAAVLYNLVHSRY